MKRLLLALVILGLAAVAAIFALRFALTGSLGLGDLVSSVVPAKSAKRFKGTLDPFDPDTTTYGIRWFPTYVHFGPDNDTLLVSLCHVQRPGFCRIGKYRISDRHWDILPFEESHTYLDPIFSPDGQWIVYVDGRCDRERRCNTYKIVKTLPDGARPEVVADVAASDMSFSHDGRKLIYWRRNFIDKPGKREYAGAEDVYQLDWATGEEGRLTEIGFAGERWDKPFFTPDAGQFIFRSHPTAFRTTNEPAFGEENRNASLFMVATQDAPVTKQNYRQTVRIWHLDGSNIADIDRQGRVLYRGDVESRRKAGNPVALAVRPPDPDFKEVWRGEKEDLYPYAKLTEEQIRVGEGARMSLREATESRTYRLGQGGAVFLRKPDADAVDEAAFDVVGSCSASVSPDSKRLAIIWGNCRSPSNSDAVVLIDEGRKIRESDLILNWSKLDLVPTQPAKP